MEHCDLKVYQFI